jgi:non-homologous end joining protein Ku
VATAGRDFGNREGPFAHAQLEDGQPLQAQYVDTETGKPIDDVDQVKGYERSEGDYVMLENEKLDAVALDSTRIIGTGSFRILPAAACRDNQRFSPIG